MKLLKYQKKALLVALHTLAKDGPINDRLGICWHLNELVVHGHEFVNTYQFVGELAVSWPGNEGTVETIGDNPPQVCWPIDNEYDPITEERLSKWEGDQLAKRTSLIQHLIDSLAA